MEVALREFCQHTSKYLKGDEVIITKFNKPFLVLKPIENIAIENVATNIAMPKILKTKKQAEKKLVDLTPQNYADPYGVCKIHRIYKQSCGCK